ncbi:MAG: putative rane protein, partial [Frankiales bacterium]|nr:putative rane protein [Frankiales bacterium]
RRSSAGSAVSGGTAASSHHEGLTTWDSSDNLPLLFSREALAVLSRLAPVLVARRRLVLVLAFVFLALAGGIGGGVAQELSAGGFSDPKAQSQRAAAALDDTFHTGASNFLLLVTAPQGVNTAKPAGTALTQRLAKEPGVTDVVSYWTAGQPITMRSKDGTQAMVLARLTGNQDDAVKKAKALGKRYDGQHDGLSVATGGEFAVYAEVGDTIERDVIRAESIAIPITAVLLILVFGSAIAASLPLLIGVLSILGTFLALHVLVAFTDVSVYSVNLATSMGLGLGIDYSLFLVTRFREELRRGHPVPDAVRETMRTAGRTVTFSAITVMLSLGALLVFPLFFLKSFAYAGISAVLFALIGALVVLPAALAALGERVNSLDLRRPVRRALRMSPPRVKELDEGFWHRIAVTVMKRPIGVGTAVVLLLVLLGLPFRNVVFGLPDDRVLPAGAQAHEVAQVLRKDFPGREAFAMPVILRGSRGVDAYAAALSRVSGVERVDAFTGRFMAGRKVAPGNPALTPAGQASRLSVVPAIESIGPDGERLARALRAVPPPSPVLIGGQAADLLDTKASLGAKLPLAIGLVFSATFILLFLFTGSLVIPVKALVLNVLSLSATFGMMVWIFQEGHLTGALGDPTVTGTLDTTMPILMFCVLFGLSMDYEVFLLSRIKEEWDASGDNTKAVAVGLERTGSLVTAAAGLLALVFLAFVTSDIAFIKLLGLGTALAVVVDATLVRGALVPAFMRLMGTRNWWAPRPLRALHDRIGLAEAESLPPRELVDA